MSDMHWWWWMILAAIFAIGEIMTMGFFIFWFAIGAAAAGVVALAGYGPATQLVVFIVVSGVLFALSRKFADRFSKPQPEGVGANRFFGKRAVVLEDIDNLKGMGSVRLGREEWRASSADNEEIPAGKEVDVVNVEGTRLIVKSAEKE